MEGLLTQVGSIPSGSDVASSSQTSPQPTTPLTLTPAPSIQGSASQSQQLGQLNSAAPADEPEEPTEPDHFGQLAMDHNGHLRWIGSSSAMTLVDAFRNITTRASRSAPRPDGTPFKHEAKTAAQNLYFPPILRFNNRALPGPEQAEFPPRDLADKLVGFQPSLPKGYLTSRANTP